MLNSDMLQQVFAPAGAVLSIAIIAFPAQAQMHHHDDYLEVMDIPGAPPFVQYVSPQQTVQINRQARVRGACRVVFDIDRAGFADNIAVCCDVAELGQAPLERGLFTAMTYWRFARITDPQTERETDLTGVIWHDEDRFEANPSKTARQFLLNPPSVGQCLRRY